MSTESQGVWCGECGAQLQEAADLPLEERQPCPECKSLRRHMKRLFQTTMRAGVGMRVTGKELGRKKPFVEVRAEPSKSIKLGRNVHHERLIDRRNNRYAEKVTDPKTRDVLHECDEPLSQHRGHGSAKKRDDP